VDIVVTAILQLITSASLYLTSTATLHPCHSCPSLHHCNLASRAMTGIIASHHCIVPFIIASLNDSKAQITHL
jgi:hypothetical protein